MIWLALACVKYPEFSQYRMPVADAPVPTDAAPRAPNVSTSPLAAPPAETGPETLPAPFQLTGTTWTLLYTSPDGTQTYDVTFAEDGRAVLHSEFDTTPDNDTWTQTGPVFELSMNDGFATYKGVFSDVDLLRGTATNGENTWGFALMRAQPLPGRDAQDPGALVEDDGLRNALAGTSWHLEDLDPSEPVDIDLTFTADGTLSISLPYEDNHWQASDGAVWFWINDQAVEHVALATWPDRMVGVAMSENGKQWGFLMEKR